MQVFNLPKVAEFIVYGLLVCLFVYIRDDDDPAFDGAHCGGFVVRLHYDLIGERGRRDIDVHFVGRHDGRAGGFRLLDRRRRVRRRKVVLCRGLMEADLASDGLFDLVVAVVVFMAVVSVTAVVAELVSFFSGVSRRGASDGSRVSPYRSVRACLRTRLALGRVEIGISWMDVFNANSHCLRITMLLTQMQNGLEVLVREAWSTHWTSRLNHLSNVTSA